jgi:rRNA maturation protein Nop10
VWRQSKKCDKNLNYTLHQKCGNVGAATESHKKQTELLGLLAG